MLTSISPVGESGRGQHWGLTVTTYVVGSVLGGAVVGTIAGGLGATVFGWLADRAAFVILGLAAAGGLFTDATRPQSLPTWHRQVNEQWLGRYRGWVYGSGYGFQLGLGMVTIVTSSLVYVAFVAALLTRSVMTATAVGAVFGLARALPLLSMWRMNTTAALALRHRKLDALRGPVARVTHVLLAVTILVTVLGAVV
jgi:MFS family permease